MQGMHRNDRHDRMPRVSKLYRGVLFSFRMDFHIIVPFHSFLLCRVNLPAPPFNRFLFPEQRNYGALNTPENIKRRLLLINLETDNMILIRPSLIIDPETFLHSLSLSAILYSSSRPLCWSCRLNCDLLVAGWKR